MDSYRLLISLTLVVPLLLNTSCSLEFLESDSREALKQGSNYWQERLLKCGDSWYARWNGIIEAKDVKFKLHKKQLTEADKANGYEWRGTVEWYSRIYRDSRQGGVWREWNQDHSPPEELEAKSIDYRMRRTSGNNSLGAIPCVVNLFKKHGEWIVEETPNTGNILLNKVMSHQKLPIVDFKCDSVTIQ